jgi:hypothetical protein
MKDWTAKTKAIEKAQTNIKTIEENMASVNKLTWTNTKISEKITKQWDKLTKTNTKIAEVNKEIASLSDEAKKAKLLLDNLAKSGRIKFLNPKLKGKALYADANIQTIWFIKNSALKKTIALLNKPLEAVQKVANVPVKIAKAAPKTTAVIWGTIATWLWNVSSIESALDNEFSEDDIDINEWELDSDALLENVETLKGKDSEYIKSMAWDVYRYLEHSNKITDKWLTTTQFNNKIASNIPLPWTLWNNELTVYYNLNDNILWTVQGEDIIVLKKSIKTLWEANEFKDNTWDLLELIN